MRQLTEHRAIHVLVVAAATAVASLAPACVGETSDSAGSDESTGTARAQQQADTSPTQTPEETGPVSGEYVVDAANSSVSFTSIKNSDIGVAGYFTAMDGTVEVAEKLSETAGSLTVDLTTLSTGNEVRDDRVLQHFFEAVTGESEDGEEDAPESSTVRFDIEELSGLEEGALDSTDRPVTFDAEGAVTVHGTEKTQTFHLEATRLDGETIAVETVKPYVFSIESFELTEPLEKLMEVCGHDDISDAVPVHLDIQLERS